MHRSINGAFALCRSAGRAVLIPYVTSGHPPSADAVDLMHGLEEAGADLIELGIPFSDPLADGPVIQASSFSALEGGASVAGTLEALAGYRRSGGLLPVVVFSYLNPLLRYGLECFLIEAEEAGADGLLLTDLPLGEDPEIERGIRSSSLDLIRLIAPTTAMDRVGKIGRAATGFVYYIARTGVTGGRGLRDALAEEVRAVMRAVDLPVAVGFGIATLEDAARVASVADGVVVGSALVRQLEESGIKAGMSFVKKLRTAMGFEGGAVP